MHTTLPLLSPAQTTLQADYQRELFEHFGIVFNQLLIITNMTIQRFSSMNWRLCLTGVVTGDQAIFVRRTMFEHPRGVPDQPLIEDVTLNKRLLVFLRPACIGHCVMTSDLRSAARGGWRTILLMWRLHWAYWRGTYASELARLHR